MKTQEKNIELREYNPEYLPQIEDLLNKCFGPGRFAKTAYRLRENNIPLKKASITLWQNGKLFGNIEHWPILIGNTKALLLGPFAIDTDYRGLGYASILINECLQIINKYAEFQAILLVGDQDYYQRYGFTNKFSHQIKLPGPVNKNRLLIKELVRLNIKDDLTLRVRSAQEILSK